MSERSELHDAIERAIKEHCAGGDLWLCAHIASEPFDARIAELERECAQWRDELRIYRETEDARIAELEYRLSRLLHAAENVRRWDWSDNDEDCVDDILKLGDAIDAARANGGES